MPAMLRIHIDNVNLSEALVLIEPPADHPLDGYVRVRKRVSKDDELLGFGDCSLR